MSMYVAAAGDIVRATIAVMYADSQLEECNLGLQCQAPGAASPTYLTGLATQVYNLMAASYISVTPNNCRWLGCKVSVESPHPAPTPGLYSVSVAGTGGANSVPTQVRPIIKLRTDLVGRRFRGRMYMPTPDSSGAGAAGYPSGAVLAAINAYAVTILGPYNPTAGSSWLPCVIHRVTLTNLVLYATTITSALAAPGFGTQRRSGNTGRVNIAPW